MLSRQRKGDRPAPVVGCDEEALFAKNLMQQAPDIFADVRVAMLQDGRHSRPALLNRATGR